MNNGDIIYVLDNEYGHLYNKYEVLGQTSRSWCVIPFGSASWQKEGWLKDPKRYDYAIRKLPKTRQLQPNDSWTKDGWRLGTEKDAALALWGINNRYAIASRVQVADYKTMLEVAKLVGFPLPEGV